MIAIDPNNPDLSAFVQDALRRRFLQFYARRWRPVPSPAGRAQPSFWATSWEDAQVQFREETRPGLTLVRGTIMERTSGSAGCPRRPRRYTYVPLTAFHSLFPDAFPNHPT